jgi:glycerophosphoryl diester phosphodiesterase
MGKSSTLWRWREPKLRHHLAHRELSHRPGISIIAHRGRTTLVESENTLEAFQSAIALGIPYIEFDLRRTQDGYIICYHDKTIDGTRIRDLTYDRILAIAQTKGVEIPLFEEVLSLCSGKIGLDIEVKEKGYENQIISIALKYLDYSEFVMKSFNDSSVRKIKNIDPKIRAGLLLGKLPPKYLWFVSLSHIFPEYRIFKTGADFVSPNHKLLKLGFLWRMDRIGRDVYIWTVNEERLLAKFLTNRSISAIITDRPELAMKILASIES